MRRWAVYRRGVASRKLRFGHTIPKGSQMALQRFNGFPLRRDGGVQVLNYLVLMGYTDFEFIKA